MEECSTLNKTLTPYFLKLSEHSREKPKGYIKAGKEKNCEIHLLGMTHGSHKLIVAAHTSLDLSKNEPVSSHP